MDSNVASYSHVKELDGSKAVDALSSREQSGANTSDGASHGSVQGPSEHREIGSGGSNST